MVQNALPYLVVFALLGIALVIGRAFEKAAEAEQADCDAVDAECGAVMR